MSEDALVDDANLVDSFLVRSGLTRHKVTYAAWERVYRAALASSRPEPLDTFATADTLAVALAETWALSGRAAPLMEQMEWQGFAASLLAVLQAKHSLALASSRPEPMDVDRLARALKQADDTQGLIGYAEWADRIAREYDRLGDKG